MLGHAQLVKDVLAQCHDLDIAHGLGGTQELDADLVRTASGKWHVPKGRKIVWKPKKPRGRAPGSGPAARYTVPIEFELVVEKGTKKSFRPGKQETRRQSFVLSATRAGLTDLRARAPSLHPMAQAHVVLVGAGAIGSFVAVELARIGVRQLDIVEGDALEPGNSVRWALGASHWGLRKAEALQAELGRQLDVVRAQHFFESLGVRGLRPGRGAAPPGRAGVTHHRRVAGAPHGHCGRRPRGPPPRAGSGRNCGKD